MIYSKSIEQSDYDELQDELVIYAIFQRKLENLFTAQHHHRAWEYARGLKLMSQLAKANEHMTIIDIGGGGSVFPQCCTHYGCDRIDVVDLSERGEQVSLQNKKLGHNLVNYFNEDFLNFNGGPYDFVVSISTIEHVPNDGAFFEKMLNCCNRGGIVYLTCDFYTSQAHPTNMAHRTYTEEKLTTMAGIAVSKGFRLYNNKSDWRWTIPYVYNYSFASLILEKL